MNGTSNIPVIKKWHLSFLDGVSAEQREYSRREIIRLARGLLPNMTIDVLPCYSLVGRIYGGDYPDGREVITHTITRLTMVLGIEKTLVDSNPGALVLLANTERNEEYYLIIEHFSVGA